MNIVDLILAQVAASAAVQQSAAKWCRSAIGWSAFGRQPTRNFRIPATIGTVRLKFGVHRGSG
jgi:hypothetical protein